MEFKGKIKKVEEKQVKGTFEFRKIIIETQESDPKYNQTICVDFTGKNCGLLDANFCKVGTFVKVQYNLRGREWTNPAGQTLYFTTINGWRIEEVSEEVKVEDHYPQVDDDALPWD